MSAKLHEFLDHGDDSGADDDGYDSEAAEVSKGRSKRRKLSHSEDNEVDPDSARSSDSEQPVDAERRDDIIATASKSIPAPLPEPTPTPTPDNTTTTTTKSKKKGKSNDTKPGVIYLSSLPPYLKPSALRNLLTQRGFEPITRLFLTPASKSQKSKNSRQLYSEGWIEFASKKTARRCAESLNAQIVGGRKGGFYHDDIWNLKYLRGMGWDELMSGLREERRELETRRDEERRVIATETKRFVEGVEEGKRLDGIKRKRSAKVGKGEGEGEGGGDDGGGDGGAVKRTWRQFEVKGKDKDGRDKKKDRISDDVQEVLGKIF